jgi:hypothetical protein
VKSSVILILVSVLLALSTLQLNAPVAAQDKSKPPVQRGPLLTRSTARHGSFRLGYAGSVTMVGAPAGSITVEGWSRNEVDISAEIELSAPTAQDLDRLAAVNGFVVDEDTNHIRIISTGTHDRQYMKAAAKDFPKNLLGLPWKLNYQIKLPAMCDLSLDAGSGPIKISGVEGTIRVNAIESAADLSLTGDDASIMIQKGSVNFTIPARAWHGLRAEVKLASGAMNVGLMPGFSGDIDADVLRLGEVKSSFPGLEPRERNGISPRSIRVRAGNGGAMISLTVGDGTIQISPVAGT